MVHRVNIGTRMPVDPDETQARSHIPEQLLFPAPRLPVGNHVLGYDESGRCPMLVENRCSIYEFRPRACRVYDCRIFATADLVPDEPGKELIAERVRRWRFEFATDSESIARAAIRAASVFVSDRAADLKIAPVTSTQRAVIAVLVHRLFIGIEPEFAAVAAAVERSTQ
jgi:Fe-S-cluster containining protein